MAAPHPRRTFPGRLRPLAYGAAALAAMLLLGNLLSTLLPATALRGRHLPPLPALPRPIVFAHRGGAGEAPESTLAAIQAAIARDPQVAIEIDVRQSRDGQIVVIHDATVERTTNGRGAVADLTLAELQALDAAHCFSPGTPRGTARRGDCAAPSPALAFPLRGRGYRIPTLAEVLAAVPPTTLLGIEVKAPGYEQAFADQLRAAGRLDRVIVGSAHDEVAARLRALLPEVPHYFPRWAATRFALAVKLSDARLAFPAYQVLATPRSAGLLHMDRPRVIAAARALGLLVAYWTVNDPREMEELLRLGADALITDYPGKAREVAERIAGGR